MTVTPVVHLQLVGTTLEHQVLGVSFDLSNGKPAAAGVEPGLPESLAVG